MKEIFLVSGKYTIVDDEDFDELNAVKWYEQKGTYTSYVQRTVPRNHKGKPGRMVTMHRQIMGLKKGDKKHIDHINHDGLDNRRCNLRICTRQQNFWNQRKTPGQSSKYKGVCAMHGKWHAYIWLNGGSKYLGLFDTEIAAAKAYDAKAKESFGDFVNCNF